MNTLASKIRLPFGHPEAISLDNFIIVLSTLITRTSKLDSKSCQSLLSAIIDYKWLDVEKTLSYNKFCESYSQFLSVLVSSFPKYLAEVCNKIIGEFDQFNNNETKHHEILKNIIKYVPTCVNSLPHIFQKCFPHHISSTTKELTNYVTNLIKVVSYCKDLQFNIWQLVIECSIKLDVELQNELDDLDDEEIEEVINGEDDHEIEALQDSIRQHEQDDDDDDGLMGETEYIETITSSTNIKILATKLDYIINHLLVSTSNKFTIEELNNGDGVSLFNTITSLFKSHILPTHFTKSIQFIIFHISQYQQELADSFLVLLIDVAFNPNESLEKRLKSMQYLSSYIARAKNISRDQVLFVFSYLIGWANKYISERENEIIDIEDKSQHAKQTGGMERFKLFYAAIQALLYIFCFRHQMLKSNNDKVSGESEWECELDKFFQRVILTKFNPLKYCDETVVFIFAKLAAKLNVCYCYSIIEHNKRERMLQTNGQVSLPSSVGNFRQKQEFLDLEAYFPYDPLVLPISKTLVSKSYVEWSEVNPTNDDEEDEDSTTSHHEDDEDDDSESDSDEDSSSDEEEG